MMMIINTPDWQIPFDRIVLFKSPTVIASQINDTHIKRIEVNAAL